jgi:hypothetical protein
MDSELSAIAAAVATVGATLFAAISAGISAWQAREARHAVELSVMLDLAARFNDVYSARNKLLADSTDLTWTSFDNTFPTLPQKINSDTWSVLREYAGFMEFVGVLVKRNKIDQSFLFDWMPMDSELWEKTREIADHMRPLLRPDLWIHWEQLVDAHREWKSKKA